MAVAYFGIDEAGYGPRLGPLCIALAGFRLRADGAGPPPDLWRALSPVICRDARGAKRGRLPIADSKVLKLACDWPLSVTHLERGVLAFARCADANPESDVALVQQFGAAACRSHWYAGEPIPLPCAACADLLRITTSRLAQRLADADIAVLPPRAAVIEESDLNDRFRATGNKAVVSFAEVCNLIRTVWDWSASQPDLDDLGPRIVVDRQGGRITYADVLTRAFPQAAITTVQESPRRSRYKLKERAGDRRMVLIFEIEAESAHLPVALASMIAKYLRELSMARFNRYWCARIAELKPTAGYAQDGGRWLRDAGPHLSREERTALVRGSEHPA